MAGEEAEDGNEHREGKGGKMTERKREVREGARERDKYRIEERMKRRMNRM